MDAPTNHAARDRRVIWDDGQMWEVFEHTPDYDRRAQPTLVFMSADVVRRVRHFPANWNDLDDPALLSLAQSW